MNRVVTRALALFFAGSVAFPALPQSPKALDQPPGSISDQMYSPADNFTLGIVGNGIHGIVGNGILQQIDPEQLVLNDRVFVTGPRSVSVMIDFQAASLDDIGPGHVLEISAQTTTTSTGEAVAPRAIKLDSLMRGQVQANGANETNPHITLLNQSVALQSYSVFYDGANEIDPSGVQAGDFVKVHGWLDHLGAPVVTRIDRLSAPPANLEVSGPVTAVDTAAAVFHINGLMIDFSSAEFVFMDASDLSVGQHLEVAGSLLIDPDTLQATTVRPVRLTIDEESKQEFDLQGILLAPAAGMEITLNGLSIIYTNQTVFDRGEATDLVPGKILEVEGQITQSGTLVADEIRFNEELLESEIRINSSIQSVNHESESMLVLGLPVSYSAATRIDDNSDSAVTVEDIDQLDVGDFIEVRGYDQPDGQNMIAATRIIKETPGNDVLRARVDMLSGNSLFMLGRHVVTNNATEYETSSGTPIGEEDFFAAVGIGTLVKAVVVPSGDELLATDLSLEDD